MSAPVSAALRARAERRREASLERALTCAFWRAVRNEPLPVMAALEAAARAIGTLYGQTAAAHGPTGCCGCGWVPDPDTDVSVLEAMLASAARERRSESGPDLADMTVLGRA